MSRSKKRKAPQKKGWQAADVTDEREEQQKISFDFIPNTQGGPDEDVLEWQNDGSYKLYSTTCKGCTKKFTGSGHDTSSLIQRLIKHCLQECQEYQFLELSRSCPSCKCLCLDEQALEKHKRCKHKMVKEQASSSHAKEEVVTVEEGSDSPTPKKEKESKEPEAPLVLNDNPATHVNGSSNNFPDVCYEYVPSEADGDELKWKSFTEPEVLSAKCKGCGVRFPTTNVSFQRSYIVHCIKGCPDYKKLDKIKYCFPCNLYCVDMNAFIKHMSTNKSCPAHKCMVIKTNNVGRGKNKESREAKDDDVKIINSKN